MLLNNLKCNLFAQMETSDTFLIIRVYLKYLLNKLQYTSCCLWKV